MAGETRRSKARYSKYAPADWGSKTLRSGARTRRNRNRGKRRTQPTIALPVPGTTLDPTFPATDVIGTVQVDPPSLEASARLGLSENNVKIRVYRMRARFRRLLEDRVRETLGAEPGELAEELRHLIRVLE